MKVWFGLRDGDEGMACGMSVRMVLRGLVREGLGT